MEVILSFVFCWMLMLIVDLNGWSLQSFSLIKSDLILAILFLCMEFVIFFDLPGSKFLKNSQQFSLQNSILLKTFAENEDKIEKIRLAVFIPTLILALVISGMFRRSQIFGYYLCFWFCINSDIAFVLASPKERNCIVEKLDLKIGKDFWFSLLHFSEFLRFGFIFSNRFPHRLKPMVQVHAWKAD